MKGIIVSDFSVTLSDLRKAGACVSGYNKAVRGVQGKPFTEADRERETHIRFAYKDKIQLSNILASNGLEDALWAIQCVPNVDRDARLFAVWCARQVQHLMKDGRSINALDVAERYANGLATDEELDATRAVARAAAWDAAWDAARDAQREMFVAMCEGRAPWQV